MQVEPQLDRKGKGKALDVQIQSSTPKSTTQPIYNMESHPKYYTRSNTDNLQQPGTILDKTHDIAELFKVAPEVSDDDDLYFWDKHDVTFNEISANAGIDFQHRFLGAGPSDRVLSKEALAALKKRHVVLYSEPPKNIQVFFLLLCSD